MEPAAHDRVQPCVQTLRCDSLMRHLLAPAGAAVLLIGCTHHTVEVRPIHMTVDVNIKVDRELDRFFDFEEEIAANTATADDAADAVDPAAEPQAGGVTP